MHVISNWRGLYEDTWVTQVGRYEGVYKYNNQAEGNQERLWHGGG